MTVMSGRTSQLSNFDDSSSGRDYGGAGQRFMSQTHRSNQSHRAVGKGE